MKKSYPYIVLICMIANFKMLAQIMPNLGSAADYGILAGANFYSQDTVTVKGKIGGLTGNLNMSNASARVNGSSTLLSNAIMDLTNAKANLSSQTGVVISNTITNQSFGSGVYTISGDAFVTGNLNLLGDSNSIFIFNVIGDLTFNSSFLNSGVNTILGSKVFWNVIGKVKIYGINDVVGNILASQKIVVSNYKAGVVSLLSQDSVIIYNAGASNSQFYDEPSTFYAHNKINHYGKALKTTTDCLTSTSNCNIITNPGFEDVAYSGAYPYAANQIDYACDWYHLWAGGSPVCCFEPNFGYPNFGQNVSIGLTADFFSVYGGGDYFLPSNSFSGFSSPTDDQLPHNNSDNYAGIRAQLERGFLFDDSNPTGPFQPWQYMENLRDNPLKKQLPSPLVPNKVYYMEFYSELANISNKSAQVAVYPMYNLPGWNRPEYYYGSGGAMPTPFFTSGTPIADDQQWHKVSGCFSTTETNTEYVCIKTYINTALPDLGSVAATTNDPSVYSPYPLTGTALGTYWTAYFFIDDIILKPLADAGPDQNVNCNNSAFIGENCSPIQGAAYSWAPADAFTSSNSTITNPNSIYSNVNFNVSGTYVYNLTVTLNNCSSTDQVVVNVVYGAPAGITMVTNGCNGTVLSVTNPVPGAVYTWQPGGLVGTSITVSPTQPTVYTLIASYGTCDNKETITVSPYLDIKPCVNDHTSGTNITIPFGTVYNASGNYTGYNFTCLGKINIPSNSSANFKDCSFLMGPGSLINMNLKSNLSIDNSHLYGCSSMWEGIVMNGQVGGNLTLTRSVLEDAHWGIWIPAAGSTNTLNNFPNKVKVYSCLFNTNYIDINYNNNVTNTIDVSNTIFTSRCLNYDPPTVGATIPSNFTSTSYVQSNIVSAPFTLPLSYISGGVTTYYSNPYIGLELNRFSSNNLPGSGNQITLTSRNIFDYHTIGIETLNFSNLKIEKQVFANGLGNAFTDKTGFGSIGIYAHNINWTVTNNAYIGNVTIGGSAATTNNFIALDYGIYALGGGTADSRYTIRNNDFKNIKRNGITFMNYNSLVNNVPTRLIQNNTFNEVNAWGIYMLNSVTTFALLNNNNFTNQSAPSIYTRYGGIYVGEIKNPSTAKYFINQNTINNIVTGIKCENLAQLVSNYNNIQLSPQMNLNSNLGYHLVNCLRPSITRNNVTGNTTPSNVNIDQGMYVQDCTSGYYTCNTLKNTLIGSQFSGQNVSTTLFENTYDYNLAGIYLTKQGFIDVQDDPIYPGQPVDNKFLNYGATQYNSYCATTSGIGTNGAASPFYIRTSPAMYNMSNNGNDPISSILQINTVSSPLPQTNTFCNGGPFSPVNRITNMASQIVNPGIYNTALIRDNNISRRQLYKVLENIAAPNNTLTAFKNSSINNAIGQFAIVDSLTTEFSNTGNTSKLMQAENINSSISITSTVDGYQKQLNSLFASFLTNNVLSSSEFAQLESIASLCPHTDGTSVWEARAFIKLFDSTEYVNICEQQTYPTVLNNTSRMAKTTVSESVNSEIKGQLIPNPNNGNFSIVMNEDVEDLKAEVYDVNGKLVCSNISANKNRIDILCSELTSGVYFVKVFVNHTYNETHRLIITK